MALFSIFVGVAGEDRLTAAKDAAFPENAETTVNPKESTAKPPKGKKPTVKLKTAADMA